MLLFTKNYSIEPVGESHQKIVLPQGNIFVVEKGFIKSGTNLYVLPNNLCLNRKFREFLKQKYNYVFDGNFVKEMTVEGLKSNCIVVKWSDVRRIYFDNANISNVSIKKLLTFLFKIINWDYYFPISGFQELVVKGYTTGKKKDISGNSQNRLTISILSDETETKFYIGKRLYRGYTYKKRSKLVVFFMKLFGKRNHGFKKSYPQISTDGVRAKHTVELLKRKIGQMEILNNMFKKYPTCFKIEFVKFSNDRTIVLSFIDKSSVLDLEEHIQLIIKN